MDRMLYLAMNGAKHIMMAQQNNSNNLANANTAGFREDLDNFMSMPVQGPGYADRTYAVEQSVGSNMNPGALISTGNDLDVAIKGDGWFTVQNNQGGEGYTRRGDFRISNTGFLETGDGKLVMGNGGPITIPPAEKVEIGVDGTLSIIPLGQDANTLAVIDRLKLVNPVDNEIEKRIDGLFYAKDGNILEADAAVSVHTGVLESSNVNSIGAMVKMINHARAYEMQIKVMKAAEDNDSASSRLLRS
ncbi:MAG: flagellar basal-body rod protein FlgF [Gammaproteobacteria bacterium]|nr:MAG: flagellar basal-body rod protein FlgF [Gammaproteobacteria bacterium]